MALTRRAWDKRDSGKERDQVSYIYMHMYYVLGSPGPGTPHTAASLSLRSPAIVGSECLSVLGI